MMKKLVASVLAVALSFSSLPIMSFSVYADGKNALTSITSWQDKIDDKIYEVAEGEEKIPVYVWYEDIDQTAVEEEVEETTGITLESLQSISEEFDEELVDELQEVTTLSLNNIEVDSALSEEMNAYLEETKENRAREKVRTTRYISERRKVSKEKYQEAARELREEFNIADNSMMFESKYAPMSILEVSIEEIEQLARDRRVKEIVVFDQSGVPQDTSAELVQIIKETTGIDEIRGVTGLDGGGVKVGVVETRSLTIGGDYPAGRCISLEPTYTVGNSHVQTVVGILGSEYGIASGATIYSASYEGNRLALIESGLTEDEAEYIAYYNAIESLLDNGVSVINSSFGWGRITADYHCVDQWVDHVVSVHNVTFVVSAGNEGDEDPHRVCAPGLAYNAITVGGYDNWDNTDISDDEIYEPSSYEELNGCEKPDLVAQAFVGYDIEGTSFSAPFVSGVVALMLQLRPSLAAYPQAIKAILMASCHHKAHPLYENETQELMTSGITEKQGAGVINPYLALCITGQGNYGVREMKENETYHTIDFLQPGYGATGLNVSLAWIRENGVTDADHMIATEALRTDLDLHLNNAEEAIASSMLNNSSTEMVYVTNLSSNDVGYTIEVQNEPIYGEDGNRLETGDIRYGYAWSIDTNHYEETMPYEGIYYLKNKNSNRYAEVNYGVTHLQQMVQSFIDEQLWIVKWNDEEQGYEILNAASTIGYLVDGNFISPGIYQAAYSSMRSENIGLNLLSNGAMKIHMLIDNEIKNLGVINNSTSAEQLLTWETQNETNKISQEWYLEKCCYLKGDVDRNGMFTSADYSAILNHIYNGMTLDNAEAFLADMDGDDTITTYDVNAVAAIVNGQ